MKWKNEDIQLLKKYYGKLSYREISEKLKDRREWEYIRHKAWELGLTNDKSNLNEKRKKSALNRVIKIVENAENGFSEGKSNDCKKFGVSLKTFNKYINEDEKLKNRWDSIDWVSLYSPTCDECSVILDENNYRYYENIVDKCGDRFSITKNRTCDECQKKKLRHRHDTVDKRLATLFRSLKGRCNTKNMEFDIDVEYLNKLYNSQKGLCYYTNNKMSVTAGDDDKISVDRLDSNKGYVKDNIVLCKWVVNRLKSDIHADEFIELCKQISKNH